MGGGGGDKKCLYRKKEGRKEMFYLSMYSTHFIYGYMASDSERRLAAKVALYASSYRKDNTYHGLCYTIRGALAETKNG